MKAWARRVAVGAVLGAAAACAVFAAWLAWDWHEPYPSQPRVVLVHVPRGMSAGQVLELMAREGVVRSRFSLKLVFSLFGHPKTLKAGTYLFERPMTPLQVVQVLNKGEVLLTKVTIPEGLRRDEVAHLLAAAGLGREKTFLRLTSDPALIRDLDPAATTLEGYLFPETYLVDPDLREEAVLKVLVTSFRSWWEKIGLPNSDGMPIREVVTLASLVEKETAAPQERPLVAGVFLNRLRIGMPLQTDPTIVYAETIDGVYRGYLTRQDWEYPSPYNTYLHAGLPPGPICSPGKASLEAVLHPTPSDYLYFVSRNDGTHYFSRTLAEHDRAVERFQRRARAAGIR
ncbi:MAG: endolytic transglycosylase MltG [Acidobacteriota bacterium]